MTKNNLSHLILKIDEVDAKPFVSNRGFGGDKNIPIRNRTIHAENLKRELMRIKKNHSNTGYFSIKFSGQQNKNLLWEDLDKKGFKMELLSIKRDGNEETANVRIDSAKTFDKLFSVLDKYVNPSPRNGIIPKNPKKYISSIEHIREINLKDLFTDDISLFPNDGEEHWWEIWITNNSTSYLDDFIQYSNVNGMIINEHPLIFKDRIVFLLKSTIEKLESFVKQCSLIAEIRIAKRINKPIVTYTLDNQVSLLNNLKNKIHYEPNNNAKIVILDHNFIKKHPLLNDAIVDNQKVLESFNPGNRNGHATEIASLSLLGNIQEILDKHEIKIHHQVEGVQIYDDLQETKELNGEITEKAVDITSNNENRAYIMPVSEKDGDKHEGKPSSWSAYLDNIIFNKKILF